MLILLPKHLQKTDDTFIFSGNVLKGEQAQVVNNWRGEPPSSVPQPPSHGAIPRDIGWHFPRMKLLIMSNAVTRGSGEIHCQQTGASMSVCVCVGGCA